MKAKTINRRNFLPCTPPAGQVANTFFLFIFAYPIYYFHPLELPGRTKTSWKKENINTNTTACKQTKAGRPDGSSG